MIHMLLLVAATSCFGQTNTYLWLEDRAPERTIASDIQAPEGFRRIAVPAGSFGAWLRHLPLKKPGTPVLLHNGKPKPNQDAHYAVVDIDTGKRDLQQCADAVIRLRAEYLLSRKQYPAIHFNFTSGDRASYTRWVSGYRPTVKGDSVQWTRKARKDSSYAGFRKYLDVVFAYAGTHSLSREMRPRLQIADIAIGDVFIRGGFPGHAAIVVDVAEHAKTKEKIFLLAQSYMPAQDIHVLKNPNDKELSPWYTAPAGPELATPEWVFRTNELRCFKSERRETE